MNVSELIEELKEYPGDWDVFLSTALSSQSSPIDFIEADVDGNVILCSDDNQ